MAFLCSDQQIWAIYTDLNGITLTGEASAARIIPQTVDFPKLIGYRRESVLEVRIRTYFIYASACAIGDIGKELICVAIVRFAFAADRPSIDLIFLVVLVEQYRHVLFSVLLDVVVRIVLDRENEHVRFGRIL